MAAQVAQGNLGEYDLLMRMYLEDAEKVGLPQGPAFALLANVAIGLAVLAHGSDAQWFQTTARLLAVQP
jgi:hypothetical protein